jgi:hypothetical protein
MSAIPMITNIIFTGANSGVIRDGDIVFLNGGTLNTTQVKAPKILARGCIVPSGTYGATDYGPLGDRFRHPGTSTTTV